MFSDVTGVFVVGCAWSTSSVSASGPAAHHLYAITLRIVLNFVHDVVDKEDATSERLEQVSGIAWIGYGRLHQNPSPSSSM